MATQPKPHAPWGEYVPHVGFITVEQFELFPEEDGWAYELHEGRLVSMPDPGALHGDLQTRLIEIVNPFLRARNLGRLRSTSCYNLPLPGNTEEVLCPDLSYVSPTRNDNAQMRGSYPVLAPDLVIEIASPNDTHPEMARKIATYLQAGVRLIWAIWPATKTIEVWRPASSHHPDVTLQGNDMLDGLDVIPGFHCLAQDVFTLS